MARNKYPEETVKLILDVSQRLFIEKGFDKSSIQDIIDNMGGLSKGAIYHHFKSKDEILVAIYERLSEEIGREMQVWLEDKNLNGAQKLEKMIFNSIDTPKHSTMFSASPEIVSHPRLLAIHIKMMIEVVIPKYVEPVIIEGATDGSIKTDNPRELAQVLIIMSNIWLNPLLYPATLEDSRSRIDYFIKMMTKLGLNFIDSDSIKIKMNKIWELLKD